MPCHAAVDKNAIVVHCDDTIETVLKKIRKAKTSFAAVLDDEHKFLGVFSFKVLLKNLIPVSVAMTDGIQMDIKVSAAPGVSKRLNNLMPLPVSEAYDHKANTVSPDCPIWEGVGRVTKFGSPLCVVDDQQKFYGIITYDSLIKHLEEMQSTDA